MSYEIIVPLFILVLLGFSIIFSLNWVVKQIDNDIKKLKELK